ncbi:hypothetical protein ACIA5C_06880 [Actinoplanes sp. NPDC051343]|uniref:nSTAND1 domain-containing NTPase n=1 Tax=Actinoplanes sp. NPDC051343 TaxID=3363906 RepID=UPI00378E68C8
MLDFATPNARALLIVTARHRPGSGLPDLPTAEAALRAAAECLTTRCGLTPDQIDIVVDEVTSVVSDRLHRAAAGDGPLIVWYIGHGVPTDEASPRLFLATAESTTEPRSLPRTALDYTEVRDATAPRRLSPTRPTLIILDCCYSGRAIEAPGRAADAGFNLSSVQGTHVIAAADNDEQALIGAAGPVLTTTIVEILTDGVLDGPPSFTLNGLFDALQKRLGGPGVPSPRQHSEDGLGTRVLAPNPRYQAPKPRLPVAGRPEPGWDDQACPYPGLLPIKSLDRRLFFGRDASIAELLTGLNRRPGGLGLHAITGPSGVGKSSLVMAGLLPAIKDGRLATPAAAGWRQWVMTPGRTPMTEWAALVRATQGDSGRPAAVAGPLVIVVDQFEQLFTREMDPGERNSFIEAVTTAAARPDMLVLLVVSGDHVGRCMTYPALHEALSRLLVVGPLPLSSLYDIVAEPARKAGLGIEEGLIAAITADADPGVALGRDGTIAPGALPHIASAIHRTWQRREQVKGGQVLTTAVYHAVGGIRDALKRTAEDTFDSLAPAQQPLAERLLLDLVGEYETAGEPAQTRRRVRRADLDRPGDAPGAMEEVIRKFADQRLVSRDGTAETETVELAHEALIATWPRVNKLINKDREWFRARSRIDADADEYHRRPSRDRLYRGRRLAAFEVSMANSHRGPADLSERSHRFLAASRRYHRLQRAVLAVLAVVLLGLTAVSSGLGVINRRQRDDATAKALAVQAAQLMPNDPALGRQLAVAGYAVTPSADARASLLATQAAPEVTRLADHSRQSFSSASSADGRVLVTAGTEGTANVWNMADSRRPVLRMSLTGASHAMESVAVSPDGTLVAAGDEDGVIHTWRLTGPATFVPLRLPQPHPSGAVTALAFDDDGHRLAAGSAREMLLILPIDDPARHPAQRQLNSGINSLAFQPGHDLLAGALDSGNIGLWRLGTGTTPRPVTDGPPGFTFSAKSVAFSPDGGQMAAADAHAGVRLWAITQAGRLSGMRTLTGPQDVVYAMAFSPDSGTLAAATNNGRVLLWPTDGSAVAPESLPHPASVHGVRFTADGQSLATSGQDGILRVWHRPGRDVATGQPGPVLATLSGDGKLAATGGIGGTVRLWTIGADRSPVHAADLPRAYDAPIQRMAFSADGRLLAVPIESGEIDLWDVTRPARPAFVTAVLGTERAPKSYVVTFSPDGTLLAAGGELVPPPDDGLTGTLRVWNITRPHAPALVASHRDRRGDVAALSFSADGRLIAAGGGNGEVRLYRTDTPQMPQVGTVDGNDSFVHSVRFAPEGHRLAIGDERGRVRIVDADHPRRAPQLLAVGNSVVLDLAWLGNDRIAAADNNSLTWIWTVGDPVPWARLATHSGPVFSVGADRSGSVLVTTGSDSRLQVFDTDPHAVRNGVCRSVGTPMNDTEWHQIEPGSAKPHFCD